mmetsp:Transcript_24095/g.76951  ORF Transcript_24095/g.76951 Transcript_24095/m.76951 type:complete len:100 (-) Transcript_24095:2290-2589(-)
MARGDQDGALRPYEEALDITEQAHGTRQHTSVASTLDNIAMVNEMKSDLDGALRLHEEAADILEHAHGTRQLARVTAMVGDIAGLRRKMTHKTVRHPLR